MMTDQNDLDYSILKILVLTSPNSASGPSSELWIHSLPSHTSAQAFCLLKGYHMIFCSSPHFLESQDEETKTEIETCLE